MRPLLLVALLAVPLCGETVAECQALRHHGKTAEARQCFTRLASQFDPYLGGEGLWGLGRYQDAGNSFKAANGRSPKNAHILVRWGRLFLERFNSAEAEKCFQEALALDAGDADAMLGLALVASEGFEQAAVKMAEKALEKNPKLVEARELLARLALEDSNEPKAIEEADKAIALSPEALDAMAVRAAIDLMHDKPETPWLPRIFAINPVYGEANALAGHFFVLNRRYVEGISQYRKALELSPRLWSARSQMGINLMRLGRDDDARKELEMCYENEYRDAATVNSLRLLDSYKNFVFVRKPRFILKLEKKESALLEPYFAAEMERVLETYDRKYQMKLSATVQIEVYPNHEDFAVRTMGMPGLGALGVTFGTVIAMDSPSGRRPGGFHWASTLWHEMSHVYVLTATEHRVPRWFTEGMAVHEETAAAPDWGDRLDPEAIGAIANKKLLPIAQLDRGFIRPSYPSQVVVSYFQAGKICDYITERWGYGKLLGMMRAFGRVKTTPDVVQELLGMKPEDFDKQFLEWLDKQTATQVKNFGDWRKRAKTVAGFAKEKKYDEVIGEGLAIRDLYPDYVEAGSVYEFLAEAYEAKGDKAKAAEQLAAYSRIGGRNPITLEKLAAMQAEAGDKEAAAKTLERINFIYLEDEEQHRRLGELAMDLARYPEAIREFRAAVALKPIDTAGAHFRLAQALRSARRFDDAREELLYALEAAPGFRPAQKMLLELEQKD